MKIKPEEKIWEGGSETAGPAQRLEPPPPQPYLLAVLELTKIKKVILSLITVLAGYLCAMKTGYEPNGLAELLVGSGLSLAGAAALNQWIERERDKLMERTRTRPVPSGKILPLEAAAIGAILLASGLATLAMKTNFLTAALAAGGALFYVVIYPVMKSRSIMATHAGAVCGAIPPLMGWTAATGSVSGPGAALFAILFLWQIPHFMAESSLFREDFMRGGYRNLPVIDPTGLATSNIIIFHIICLFPACRALEKYGVIGVAGLAASFVACAVFLVVALAFRARKTRGSAALLFRSSIACLSILLAVTILSSLIH